MRPAPRAARGDELTALGLLAVANVALPRLSRCAVVPASLATAAAIVSVARRADASWRDLGMDPAAAPQGIAWGLAAALPAAASVALVARTAAGRRVVVDEQAATAGRGDLAYHLLVRIPFATAVPEEVVFRSALPWILGRRRSSRAAEVMSAALFGLWHVVDAVEQLGTHPERKRVTSSAGRRAAVVFATVATTGAAGLGLSALRRRAGSVLAPVLVHAALNAAGLLAGAAIARRGAVPATVPSPP